MTLPVDIHTKALPLLADPPFVIGLFWLACGLGWQALQGLRAPMSSLTRVEKGLLSTALGLGLLQYVGFALGMLGILGFASLAAAYGALALWCLPAMIRVAQAGWRARKDLRPIPPWLWATVAVLLPALLAAAVRTLTPPTDIDGIYYHLTGPLRWLQHGRMDYLPSLFHTNMPMGVDMLFMAAIGLWSDTSAKLIHFGFGILACLALFALGRRVRGPAVGALAAVAVLYGLPPTRTFDLMTYAYVDLGIVAQLSSAILAWVLWRRSGERGWLAAAALLSGFAATCKLTVAVSAVALAVLTTFEERSRSRAPGSAVRTGILFLAVAMIPLLPWMARAAILTGNPFYPLFAGALPTKNWPGEAAKSFETFFRYYVWGTGGAGQAWPLAKRKLILFSALGIVGLATAVWLRLDRNRETRALAAVSGLSALVALWSTGIYLRYFLPFMPLALIAVLAHLPVPVVPRIRWIVPAAAAVVGIIGFRREIPELGPALASATGRLSRSDFIAARYPSYSLWEYASAHLPPDARILQTAGRGSYYIRPYCYITEAIYQHVIRMDTWENYNADVVRESIGYALLTKRGTDLRINMDFLPAANEMDFAERLAAERGELIKEVAGDRLYRLRPVADSKTHASH